MVELSVRNAVAGRVEGGPIQLREIADGLGLTYPLSVRALIGLLDPVVLNFQLQAGSSSGTCELQLTSAGYVQYSGAVHDSGLFSVEYGAMTVLQYAIEDPDPAVGLVPLIVGHTGTMSGTLGFGSRDDSWNASATSSQVRADWRTVKKAAASARTTYGTSTDLVQLVEALGAAATGAWVLQL